MGKDKKSAAAPAVPAAGNKAGGANTAADAKAVGSTSGTGRGHRQRGAGTVITAKPAVVTNDGIVLKSHERLPTQVLHEYCQREKRPLPRYFREPPGLRFKVILEDAKNSRHDMQFCPVQSFESETMARNYAALLALFHVQKSIPLERKLPEPFAATWLQLIRGTDSLAPGKDTASIVTSTTLPTTSTASSSLSSSAAAAAQSSVVSSHSHSSAQSSAGATTSAPQWLCDSCATPNFVNNANGTIRTKCFRCQTPKPDVVSMTSAPSKLNGASSTAGSSAVPIAEKKPQVVLDLQAKKGFASVAEREAEAMQRKQRQTSHITYLDALKNANPINTIQIPMTMRSVMEKLLQIRKGDDGRDLKSSQERAEDVKLVEDSINVVSALSPNEQHLYSGGWLVADLSLLNGMEMSEQSRHSLWCVHSFLLATASTVISEGMIHKEVASLADIEEYWIHVTRTRELSSSELTEKKTLLQEEHESISAILGDEMPVEFVPMVDGGLEVVFHAIEMTQSCVDWLVEQKTPLPANNGHNRQLKVTIHIPAKCAYPSESPIVFVGLDLPEITGLSLPMQELLCSMNIRINEKVCSEWKGAMIIYEVFSFLQHLGMHELSQILTCTSPKRISEHMQSTAAKDSPVETDLLLSLATMTVQEQKQKHVVKVNASHKSSTGPNGASKAKSSAASQSKLHPFWRRILVPTAMNDSIAPSPFDVNHVPSERKALPAWRQRNEFLAAIAQQECVIVTGETGCGKTTQIPQYLHEKYPDAKILVCQPRRLAATGVAQRVAEEVDMLQRHASALPMPPSSKDNKISHQHGTNPVGYMVKGDSSISQHTRIAFATYGVLLRRLQDDPALESMDFVILDEVHERGIDSDFCLALLLDAIQTRRHSKALPPLKLILMSATISTDYFRNYLLRHLYASESHTSAAARALCPIVDIPGRTFPVTEFFKQEFEPFALSLSLNQPATLPRNGGDDSDYSSDEDDEEGGVVVEAENPQRRGNNAPSRDILLNNPHRSKDVNYDLLVRLVFTLILGRKPPPSSSSSSSKDLEGADGSADEQRRNAAKWERAEGCILIFLPGVPEITKVLHYLRLHWPSVTSSSSSSSSRPRLELLALHGNLSPAEQRQVFVTYPKHHNVVKIVAATNVAEASVTIPDVTVVIDTCRVKEMTFDSSNHAWQLALQFAAQDSLRQRKGRAGRVQEGRCYRLITRNTFETKLAAISTPEMVRMPLDNVLLQTFAMMTLSATPADRSSMNVYDRCLALLSKCPSPPSELAITRARDALVSLQALASSHVDDNDVDDNVDVLGSRFTLTALGTLLSRLPMIPRIGKLLIYGRLLQCTLPAVCIAAALSSSSGNKPIFLTMPSSSSSSSSRDRATQDVASLQAAVLAVKERIIREQSSLHRDIFGVDAGGASSEHAKQPSTVSSDYYVIAQLLVKYLSCHTSSSSSSSSSSSMGGASLTASRKHFCRQHYLHFERMQEIAVGVGELVEDIRELGLLHAGLVHGSEAPACSSHAHNRHERHAAGSPYLSRQALWHRVCDVHDAMFNRYATQPRLLSAVFVAGLYPQVVQVQRPPKKFIEVMGSAVERDVLAKEIAFYEPTPPDALVVPDTSTNKKHEAAGVEGDSCMYMRPVHQNMATSKSPMLSFAQPRDRDAYFSACIVRKSDISTERIQRVFVHPSSINFSNSSFQSKHHVLSNYLLYAEKQCVVTGYDAQSKSEDVKIYLRDTSEVSPLALVLFGGDVQVIDIPPDIQLEEGLRTKRVLVTVDQWIRFYATPRDAQIMVSLKAALQSLLQEQLTPSQHGVSGHSETDRKGPDDGDSAAIHPIIEATCAVLDNAVTVTGTISSLTVMTTMNNNNKDK